MSEVPPVHPIVYVAVGIPILCVILGIVATWVQTRTTQAWYTTLVTEIYRITKTIRSEGRATRHLLVRQEQRRRQRLAREAKLRLKLGPELSDAPIAVQRILDAGGEEEKDR